MFDQRGSSDHFYLETKMGIVTQTGEWFHTTAEQIDSYAPGLLDSVSLGTLIREAHAWVKSSDSLALMLLYGLLFVINPWIAGIAAVAFHWCWHHYKSAVVVRGAGSFLKFLNSDGFMFVIAFISLTLLGFQQAYIATGIGILGFFVIKPGFLRKAWNKINRSRANELTLNDRVLKMVIAKHAIWANASPADIQEMEDRLRELAVNRKKGNKSE